MDFEQSVKYLLSLGHETLTIKLGLRNTELLLAALDNPERAFPSVQIAGTNGKGSTAVMLDSICRAAGIKSGLYTSPHLVSITERIKISGIQITTEEFAACATAVRDVSEKLEALPTFFEQITAIALLAFRNATRYEPSERRPCSVAAFRRIGTNGVRKSFVPGSGPDPDRARTRSDGSCETRRSGHRIRVARVSARAPQERR